MDHGPCGSTPAPQFAMRRAIPIAPALFVIALLGLTPMGCQRASSDARAKQEAREVQELLTRAGGGDGVASRVPVALPPGTRFTRDDLPTEGGYVHLPLVEITDAQADRLLQRLKTEYCTCGCPHTIDDCLIQDPACTTARTLAHQVLKEVITGS